MDVEESRGRELRNHDKVDFISVLQAVACCSVVALHVNGIFWTRPSGRLWITSNLIESACYFAVPVFLMITGATLMDFRARYSLKEYALRRIRRTLIPFLFWSIAMYSIARWLTGIPAEKNVWSILLGALNCKYAPLYWFFWVLFGCYLSIPVLSHLVEKKRTLVYLVAYVLISCSLFPFVFALTGVRMFVSYNSPLMGGVFVFPVLGYLLFKLDLTRKYRMLIYMLGFAGFCLHFFGTWALSPEGGPVSKMFKGYDGLPSVLYASAIFIFFKNTNWNFIFSRKWASFVVRAICEQSFGIYLLYLVVIWIINRYDLHFSRMLSTLLCVFVLTVFLWIVKRVPIVKILLP